MSKPAKIYVVEDDTDLNDAYRMILASAGYEVVVAYSGKEALEIVEKHGDPDIMLLDLRMPIMDGIEFLKRYEAPTHKDTTVVVFSNYDAQSEVDEAYSLGAERYVLKARAAPKELLRIVEDILSEKE